MPPQIPNLECLAARVTKLETQNRRLKCTGAALAVLVAALAVMGQAQPARIIDANEFVLKDKSGVARARLYMQDNNTPSLYFYGPTHSGLPLALKAGDEPAIILNRAGTSEQVQLADYKDFYGLVLFDAKSHRAGLSVQKGTAALDLFDHEGTPRATLTSGPPDPVLMLLDKQGKRVSSLP
jgi:hypothetical protein